jgi:hypothetical protein
MDPTQRGLQISIDLPVVHLRAPQLIDDRRLLDSAAPDFVGNVARAAAFADRASEGPPQFVVRLGTLAQDDEGLDHAVGALRGSVIRS